MVKYRLNIEYVGTKYNGWQKQENGEDNSIQTALENAIFKFCGEHVFAYSCGRTDAGVHAISMPVHIETKGDYCHYKMLMAVNFHLKYNGDDISVLSINRENEDFHARFSCKQRHYVYKIFNRSTRSVIKSSSLWWWVYKPLNIEKMMEAANLLLGTHDFSTFRASGCQAKSPIKTINSIKIEKIPNSDEIHFYISAPSFLYHQVRNIVGSLVLVGKGNWSIEDFKTAFDAKDRTKGGSTAPASGLYFLDADY